MRRRVGEAGLGFGLRQSSMTIDEGVDRLTAVTETLAGGAAAHDSIIEALNSAVSAQGPKYRSP